jgi:hypothetical protein
MSKKREQCPFCSNTECDYVLPAAPPDTKGHWESELAADEVVRVYTTLLQGDMFGGSVDHALSLAWDIVRRVNGY